MERFSPYTEKSLGIDRFLGLLILTPLFLSIPVDQVYLFIFSFVSPIILLRNGKRSSGIFEFSLTHIWLLLFLIYVFINAFLIADLDKFSLKYFKLFFEGILLFFILTSCFKKGDLDFLSNWIVILSVLAFLQGLIQYYYGLGAEYMALGSSGEYEIFSRPIPAGFDPNYYYLHIIFPLCYIFYKLPFQEQLRLKILHWILIFIFVLAAFFTASKSALIITFLILLYFLTKSLKGFLYSVLFFLLISFLVIPILLEFFPYSFLRYDSIFSGNMEQLTTNRNIMWKISALNFLDNPIFGVGLGQMVEYYSSKSYFVSIGGQTTHNTYIHTLAELGLLGFVLFFSPIINLTFSAFKIKSFLFPVLVASFIMLMTIDAGYYKIFLVYLAITYLITKK